MIFSIYNLNFMFMKKSELISLNEGLYTDFFVQELEQRLETDPFFVGGFIDSLPAEDVLESSDWCVYCELNCTIY
jgi:hypothetical protein